ncbi:ATP-binding cassette domain-containing protein [Dermatobacter hominis]|uniref:ATP-binding cassette domain-containing protein n=1 Tax=Dermatobacter hominis TaxID=2884263 RepID=UPI001D11B442|nr:ABC transporter ATP-binding protein [Dermatobacter hominis]UDY35165.1 ABC transporter ATP-binding protein/permease [Dermatobacter hominis]
MAAVTGSRVRVDVRALVHDRLRLLRLLGVVPLGSRVGITAAMLAVSLLPAGIAIAVAWLVGRVVEVATDGGALSTVAVPLAVVGALLAVDQVTQSMLVPFRDWVASTVNGRVRRTVRRAVSARPGVEHLESQVVRDAAALPIENAYLFNLGAGAEGQLWLLTRFVGAVAAAAVVARSSVAAGVAAFAFTAWQRSLLRRHYAAAIASGMVDTTADGRAASYWSEILGAQHGAKEVRLFGFADWALERFHHHARRPVDELSRVLLGAHRLHWEVFALNALAAGVPFLLLARLGVDGAITPAELTAALGGVVAVARVLGPMGWEAFSIEAAVPQMDAVARLEEYHGEERRRVADRPVPAIGTAVPVIAFEGVGFTYPDGTSPVLDGLDLVLEPGRSVAIVGENGAGKTTLLKLLAGFYRPTAGRILVDGTDLDDLDLRAWRRRLAVIFQDFTHFELSAFENISLADPGRADARSLSRRAAVAAGAATIVDGLPEGDETILSRAFTGGVDLSGGQWQRIALARAMYAAAVGGQVVILDEPTASLDVSAEVELFDQLLTHAAGCTAVVVSHRFSTVRRAERIVVLAGGRVAEDGSHAELMALGSRYAELYELQARRFRDERTVPPGPPADGVPEEEAP